MKKMLKRVYPDLHYNLIGERRYGPHKNLRNVDPDLHGDCTSIYGDADLLLGDCRELSGDVSLVWGDCTGVQGNLDDCQITEPIDIKELML